MSLMDKDHYGLETGSQPAMELSAHHHSKRGDEADAPMRHCHNFHLIQDTTTTQHVALAPDSVMSFYPQYQVQINPSTGFMNRKPDMIIAREGNKSEPIAKGRFEKYAVGTTLEYPDANYKQSLDLESTMSQRYNFTLNGSACAWQLQPMDKSVVTLDMENVGLIARIAMIRVESVKKEELVAVVQVRENIAQSSEVLDQIICTGVVLVERFKRRKMIVGHMREGGLFGLGLSEVVVGASARNGGVLVP